MTYYNAIDNLESRLIESIEAKLDKSHEDKIATHLEYGHIKLGTQYTIDTADDNFGVIGKTSNGQLSYRMDSVPTSGSSLPVKSGGVYQALSNIETTLSGKQDVLTAGDNISIENGIISATGSADSVTAGTGISVSSAGKISLNVAGSYTNGNYNIGGIYTKDDSCADIDRTGKLKIKFPHPTAFSNGYPAVFRIPDGDLTVGQVFIYPGGGPEMGKYVCLSDVSSMDLQTRVGGLETQMNNKQETLVFDDSPKEGSNNIVSSGAIKTYIDNIVGDIKSALEAL